MSKSRSEVNQFAHEAVEIGDGVSADYVIAHATRQRQRGKNPSLAYKGENNPRAALELAKSDIVDRTSNMQRYWDGHAALSGRVAILHAVNESLLPTATRYAETLMNDDAAVGADVRVRQLGQTLPVRPVVQDGRVEITISSYLVA